MRARAAIDLQALACDSRRLSRVAYCPGAKDSVSDPQIVKIAASLREAAEDNQCAYWNFREAMGGDGSMARFFHANLAAKDLYHFTRKGASFMADRLVHALLGSFETYLHAHSTAGCRPPR